VRTVLRAVTTTRRTPCISREQLDSSLNSAFPKKPRGCALQSSIGPNPESHAPSLYPRLCIPRGFSPPHNSLVVSCLVRVACHSNALTLILTFVHICDYMRARVQLVMLLVQFFAAACCFLSLGIQRALIPFLRRFLNHDLMVFLETENDNKQHRQGNRVLFF
jgi:hypothetical protein